ncbi:MAG: hypothetical protein ACKODH_16835 [Limisphaerales bacterium]
METELKPLFFVAVLCVTTLIALIIWAFTRSKDCDSVDASSGAEAGSWEGYGENDPDAPDGR